MRNKLDQKFEEYRSLAEGSKGHRIIRRTGRYLKGVGYTWLAYPFLKRPLIVNAHTFWGVQMKLPLPAGLDIYLTGGKSHDSEVRLTRWCMENLEEGAIVWDIGAHLGYYSLLFSFLTGEKGIVHSFEPSNRIMPYLESNLASQKTVTVHLQIIGNESGPVRFYDFPILYSEFNTMVEATMRGQQRSQQPQIYNVQGVTIDDLIKTGIHSPGFIKMDVEGAEELVILGGEKLLSDQAPIIAMEFQLQGDKHKHSLKAISQLIRLGYSPYQITRDGECKPISNVETYGLEMEMESDNLILKKSP